MRKAQLQMMENAFILLIIFIILIIAFVFVIGAQRKAGLEKEAEFKELELIKKSQILNFLPEMQCSVNNNIYSDCYDMLKIEAFKNLIAENKEYYLTLLGKINITIRKYEPSPNHEGWTTEWNVYDNPKEEYNGVKEVKFPVRLFNATEQADYFGVIFIKIYE